MSGLDREARATIPLQSCAGVVRSRAFAAKFVQAPALTSAFIIKGLGELAPLVERPAIATVVNVLTEKCSGPTEGVQFRNRAKGQEMREQPESAGSQRH